MKLVTRSDFDGLCCAVLLREMGLIDGYRFVHPKDVQDGKVEVSNDDVLANIPYVPGCGMWFDHHSSEKERLNKGFEFKGASRPAPSCARVIWDYYGGAARFPKHFEAMMTAVDKSDSADLTREEIENPQGWILLSYVMDPRTGLGRYRDYRISNYQLMEDMIEYCRVKTAEEILLVPDVQERVTRYNEQNVIFLDMIKADSSVHGNVVVLDLRNREEIFTGNRFLLYTVFPQCNVSIQIMWGFKQQNIVFTCGYSVINKSCRVDVGSLMLKYGGGGHTQVGTCQIPVDDADRVLEELIAAFNA